MASRKAKAFLRACGYSMDDIHTRRERTNFAAGTGTGLCTMPYHVIRMDSRTGDSKRTVGWARDLAGARRLVSNLRSADDKTDAARGGGEIVRNRYFSYYIRDIRTDTYIK